MAVFLINICKFNGCGITFPSLGDLIQHIEDTHIDYDPKVVEQKEQAQPTCLPLSYVLRFITDAARKESPFLGANGAELKRKLAIKHHSYSMSSSNRSNTPTGSELDEDEMIISESEDSNDSWTTEEFSSEFIMRYGSRHSGTTNGAGGNEKPFACPVPGCKKRYKNVNGIKYHSKNGHKKDGKVRKGYKCHCGKSYKTAQGLKSHAIVAHNTSPENINVSNVQIRSTSPSQSIGSLSPSSISNLSANSGTCATLSNNLSTNQNPQQQQSQQQQQQQQLQTATNSNLSSTTLTTGNNLMRGNIGLISIKTTKPNLIATSMTANKILKLATSDTGVQQHDNNKIKFYTSSTKLSLPGLVNLGIITPATSPKIQNHAFQQQQQQQQQNLINTNSTTTNNNNNTNTPTAVNNNNNQNQGNHDNLPLTPISPNIAKSSTATTVSFHTSVAAAAAAVVAGVTVVGTDKLITEET